MHEDSPKYQAKKVTPLISEDEAARLYQTGDWITDLAICDRVDQESKDILVRFPNWPSSSQTPDVKARVKFFQECPAILSESESIEAKYITQRFDHTPGMELRIKPGTVFKVKSAALDLGINGMGLILAIFSTTTWPLYFPVWLCLSLTVLIRTLYKHWESIRDPDERLVFEGIFRYQGRACVINHDALQNRKYDEAYGFIAPTAHDLSTEIGGQITYHAIIKALASLESRGIVKERYGRWSISF